MSCPTTRPSTGNLSAGTSRPQGHALLYAATILAALLCLAGAFGPQASLRAVEAGSCRSQNFIVSAPTTQFARQVCAAAEQFRRDLAIEWLGRELPPWQDPCPIRVIVGSRLGAGGATSFTFIDGQPRRWDMEIQGSSARILDSVLPHEVTHTIMATHFGRPLPRWADEGAATSVEHTIERTKQDKLLIEFLTTNRGIAFNRMFAMKEYPQDILPLYSQGYSLARYLIARGGKRRFVAYVGDGMRSGDWSAATREHYSMKNLSELQLTWLDWVRQGSPAIAPDRDTALADAGSAQPDTSSPNSALPGNTRGGGLVPLPDGSSGGSTTTTATLVTSPSDGWYSRRRDEAARQAAKSAQSAAADGRQRLGRPSNVQRR